MKNVIMFTGKALVLAAVTASLAGCSAFQMSVKDKAPTGNAPLTAKYDQSDLLTLAKQVTELILANPFPAANEGEPIIVEMGIQNRTQSHLDTKALADTITMRLLDSKKVKIVDSSLRDNLMKEQNYQMANCTPDTKVKIGKQLGARYMLTGAITEITTESGREVRLSKKEDVYYQLTLELTDLETGLLAVRKQQDRMREASKPLIGW